MISFKRIPKNFSLLTLLVVVTLFACASAYVAPMFNQPRRYPQIIIEKKRYKHHKGTAPEKHLWLQVKFKKVDFKPHEHYISYTDWETVHIVNIRNRRSPYSQQPCFSRTSKVGSMPPVYQKRYEVLRAYVDQFVDIEKQPWGWEETYLLPEDFPTIDEFEDEFMKQEKLKQKGTTQPIGQEN